MIEIMSQAAQNIAPSADTDKADTAMSAAMITARQSAKGKKAPPAKTQGRPRSRSTDQRQIYTLELAVAICPHEALAANLSRTFGLEPVDFHAIREATEEHMVRSANALVDNLNERAMAMHLQRVVGSFVASACGAGQFYGQKVSQAKDLTARLANDDRDEDRDGPSGFEDRAARARIFAAEMGLQAYALLAAAQGAVDAYAQMIGEDWKPYEAPRPATEHVSRQSAATEMAAFGA
jgi:hypothetical protein